MISVVLVVIVAIVVIEFIGEAMLFIIISQAITSSNFVNCQVILSIR